MGTKNFASFYIGIAVVERIDLNEGNPFLRGLCTLAGPKSVPDFEPTGPSLSWVSLLIPFLFLSFFKRLVTLFS